MRLNGASYKNILKSGGGILSTVKATRLATESELFYSATNRIKHMMNYGTTTCEVKSGYGLDLNNEFKMLRVANMLKKYVFPNIITTFLAAHTLAPEYSNKELYINYIIDDMLPKLYKSKLSNVIDGFCETIGFSNLQIKRLFNAAKKHSFKFKLHAEQLSDQKGAKLAAEFGALSVDHLEYLSTEDVMFLKNNNTVAVLLPGAFYFLGETKIPPVSSLLAKNIDIAIATDSNPGSSPFLSLPLMMNMACILFNLMPYQAFKAVTINAAKALNVTEMVGSIEIGKLADILLWNCNHYNEIIYNPTLNRISKYIKSGKVINLHDMK